MSKARVVSSTVSVNSYDRIRVMGIINCTPDSFSDGGSYIDPRAAVDAALQMIVDGAEWIDLGGESSRPGAESISDVEECRRILPVLRELRKLGNIPVSIDTCKASVAEAALAEGADRINDITAMADPRMAQVVSRAKADLVLMHMQGQPRTMQCMPSYTHVTEEVLAFLRQRTQYALDAGVDASKIIWDPGFGFGKTLEHNLTLFRDLLRFRAEGYPLLVGVSRKSMIGNALGLDIAERMIPSVTLAAMAAERGASFVRVHDVRQTVQAVRMAEAVLRPEGSAA